MCCQRQPVNSVRKQEGVVTDKKFSINQATLMPCDSSGFISAAATAGFNAVELRSDKLDDDLRKVPLTSIKKSLFDNNVALIGINGLEGTLGVPRENYDLIEKEVRRFAVICKELESPRVIIPSPQWETSRGTFPEDDEIVETCGENFRMIGGIVGEYGIVAGLEPVGLPGFLIKDIAMSSQILDFAALDNAEIVPDIHNLSCNSVAPSDLSSIINCCHLIHINDSGNMPWEEQHVVKTRVFPGEGIANAGGWIAEAEKSGFNGYYSLELFSDTVWNLPPDSAANLCYEKIYGFLQNTWRGNL